MKVGGNLMALRVLFNRQLDPIPRKGLVLEGIAPAGGPPPGTPKLLSGEEPVVGAFITEQSLTSFAGATGAISVIWGTLRALVPGLGQNQTLSLWLGFGVSLGIGLLIYWINITDPQTTPTPRQKAIGFAIAILNSLVLFMASFGATTLVAGNR